MKKTIKRLLCFICVLAMVFSVISGKGIVFTAFAEDGVMLLDTTKLDATGISDKQLVPDGTTFVESYFKSNGPNFYKISNDAIRAIVIEQAMKGSLTFTCGGASDVVLTVSSTGGSNTSEIALLDSNGNLVPNNEGVTKVSTTSNTILSYTGIPAGEYTLCSPENPELKRGFYLVSIKVIDYSQGARAPRELWKNVASPVITGTEINGGSLSLNFNMVIGYDGADNVTAEMVSSRGKTVDTKKNAVEGTSGSIIFTPTSTDTYSFRLYAEREGESKMMTTFENVSFTLPLADCDVISAASAGNGQALVTWSPVPEADSYDVYFSPFGDSKYTFAGTTKDCSYIVKGLTVGKKYTFYAKAKRASEISDFGTCVSATVYEDARRSWAFSAFGTGTDTVNNFFEGSVNEGDGSVRICSLNSKGKLQPTSTDGLAFYYTTVDAATENFVITGKIHVNKWTYTNGQDGFGLMACDTVAKNGDSSTVWNNSYMVTGTKVGYYFNSETNELVASSGDGISKVEMKLGIGAQEKKGVTAYAINKNLVSTSDFLNNVFSSEMRTLETSGMVYKKGNIIGNFTNTNDIGTYQNLTDFTFKLVRDNTGYTLSYINEYGKETSELFYDIERENLTSIDEDHIYVGFFASRTFDITVSDVTFTTSDPATDAPAKEREKTAYPLQIAGISAAATGIPEYEFIFHSNADGILKLTNRKTGEIITDNAKITANKYFYVDTMLEKGINGIVMEFTPAVDFKPNGEFSKLESYDKVTQTYEVTYKRLPGSVIYAGPLGDEYGKGTKESPYDVQTAISFAHPGQTIYLLGGTYKLTDALFNGRGQSGKPDEMIYLIADPESNERPVFDFDNYYKGMTIGGDYWYLAGFDITKTGNGQKGLQISGNHCIVDNVNAYFNGNTGIQITRLKATDNTIDLWPHDNLILNCTSHDNADAGYEDADGFACKLTTGPNNVFDGCIAYCNADDGWDLYAKLETGPIGSVTIRNCVAYGNGYLSDGTVAGNGNGFKLGGSSITGRHELINCIAYNNKMKGIDSNSCPDVHITNCTSFDNESYNVALYTKDSSYTSYIVKGVVSFRLETEGFDNIDPKGTQDNALLYADNNYYYPTGSTSGIRASADWFKSLDTTYVPSRNADNTINMGELLVLSDKAPEHSGAVINRTPSKDFSELRINIPDPTPKPGDNLIPVGPEALEKGEASSDAPTVDSSSSEGSESSVSIAPIVICIICIAAALGLFTFFFMRKKKK